ncbi:MAG: hypothetical protein JNK05_06605 [Myxococcales bacterium]|nr:hypothetical protein [Myxococcales bacterium]
MSAAASAVVATEGCRRADKPPTQLVLHIDSQIEAGIDLRALIVTARRAPMGPAVWQKDFQLSGDLRLPGEVGLYANAPEDNGTVYIEVQAQLARGGSFTVNAESQFIPGRVRVVPILLTINCATLAAAGTAGMCASCSACGCDTIRADVDAGGMPAGNYVTPFSGEEDRESRCQLARPPPLPRDLPNPPAPPPDAGARLCERGPCFAVRILRFDWPTMANPDAWRRHGWDLDGICTSMNRAIPTCRNPGGVVVDGENGRDNAFASRLGPYLQTLNNVSEERINSGIARGEASMGVELRGYSGTGDDGTVEALLFPIARGRAGDNPAEPPRWDGNDVWSLDRYVVVSPEDAVSNGYVAGSRIVLRLRSQTPIAFATEFGQSRFLVSGGIASGTVHCGGRQLGPIELGGFVEVRQLSNDLPFLGLCEPLQRFAVNTALAQSADLNVVGDAPVNNPNVDCNAISFGVTLVPVPIRAIEGEVNAGIRTNPCLPEAGAVDASAPDDGGADAGFSDGGDASSDARTDARIDARG